MQLRPSWCLRDQKSDTVRRGAFDPSVLTSALSYLITRTLPRCCPAHLPGFSRVPLTQDASQGWWPDCLAPHADSSSDVAPQRGSLTCSSWIQWAFLALHRKTWILTGKRSIYSTQVWLALILALVFTSLSEYATQTLRPFPPFQSIGLMMLMVRWPQIMEKKTNKESTPKM